MSNTIFTTKKEQIFRNMEGLIRFETYPDGRIKVHSADHDDQEVTVTLDRAQAIVIRNWLMSLFPPGEIK